MIWCSVFLFIHPQVVLANILRTILPLSGVHPHTNPLFHNYLIKYNLKLCRLLSATATCHVGISEFPQVVGMSKYNKRQCHTSATSTRQLSSLHTSTLVLHSSLDTLGHTSWTW